MWRTHFASLPYQNRNDQETGAPELHSRLKQRQTSHEWNGQRSLGIIESAEYMFDNIPVNVHQEKSLCEKSNEIPERIMDAERTGANKIAKEKRLDNLELYLLRLRADSVSW